jgi:hypothetical protein
VQDLERRQVCGKREHVLIALEPVVFRQAAQIGRIIKLAGGLGGDVADVGSSEARKARSTNAHRLNLPIDTGEPPMTKPDLDAAIDHRDQVVVSEVVQHVARTGTVDTAE